MKSYANASFHRYLVTDKYKVYQFIHLLRKRINLKQEEALYLFVNGRTLLKSGKKAIDTLAKTTCVDSKMSEVYDKYRDSDGFLYIEFCEYSSFGK